MNLVTRPAPSLFVRVCEKDSGKKQKGYTSGALSHTYILKSRQRARRARGKSALVITFPFLRRPGSQGVGTPNERERERGTCFGWREREGRRKERGCAITNEFVKVIRSSRTPHSGHVRRTRTFASRSHLLLYTPRRTSLAHSLSTSHLIILRFRAHITLSLSLSPTILLSLFPRLTHVL